MEYSIITQMGLDLSESSVLKKVFLSKDKLNAICGVLYLLSCYQGTLAIIQDSNGNTVDPDEILKKNRSHKHYCILTYLGHDLLVKFDSDDFIKGVETISKYLNRNYRKFIKSTDINIKRSTGSLPASPEHKFRDTRLVVSARQ